MITVRRTRHRSVAAMALGLALLVSCAPPEGSAPPTGAPAAGEAGGDLPAVRSSEQEDEAARVHRLRQVARGSASSPEAVLATLTGALKDDATQVRQLAVREIGKLGAGAREAIPSLTAALDDEALRDVVLLALRSLGKVAAPAADRVAALVEDPRLRAGTRRFAIQALEAMEEPTAAVLAALEGAARDPRPRLESVARAALERLAAIDSIERVPAGGRASSAE